MKGFKHFFQSLRIDTPRLTIRGIGVQEHMPPSIIDRPNGTGDYLFMLFYEPVFIGAGKEPALCQADTLMIWTPGRYQYYGDAEAPYTHTWIHCDGKIIASLLSGAGVETCVPLKISDPSIMERYMLALHAEVTQFSRPDRRIVENLLENWLRETARDIRGTEDSAATPEQFLRVRQFIESEFNGKITLPELAKKVGLSVPHFCAEFKRHFGTPAIDYLIRQRMHQAAYLLRDRNIRVGEIARRVGYEDLYYFSKVFKKHYGVSPRAFRKKS